MYLVLLFKFLQCMCFYLLNFREQIKIYIRVEFLIRRVDITAVGSYS